MSSPHPDRDDPTRPHSDPDATGPIPDDRTAPVAPTYRDPAPGRGTDQPGGAAYATSTASPSTGTSTATRPPRQRASMGSIATASVLSALLAAGGTYAVVELTHDGSTGAPAASGDDAAVSSSADGAADSGSAEGTPVSLTGEQDWGSVAEAVSPSTVSISVAGAAGEGSGSGVIWDTEGHIVTNAHVVEGADQVQVTLPDGRAYAASVIGTDVSSDLAVLQVEEGPADLQPIAIGDDGELGVGDPVMAVGNPLGLSGTVTTGIVSALDRPVTTQSTAVEPGTQGAAVVTNAIQTSAAINPGNSGGALVNAAGELVGINSSIASLSSGMGSQSGSIGIGFAIPSSKVQLIADQLIETGTATHAFLGVGLDDAQAEVDGAVLTGASVTQVEPGSPAEDAGMQSGDVIVSIDDEPISGATALVGQVRERGAGDETTIGYIRDGEEGEVTVTLTTRPDEAG